MIVRLLPECKSAPCYRSSGLADYRVTFRVQATDVLLVVGSQVERHKGEDALFLRVVRGMQVGWVRASALEAVE